MSILSGASKDLGAAAQQAGDALLAEATADVTQQIVPAIVAALETWASGKRVVVTVTLAIEPK